MKKNILIAALLCWNLILTGAFIVYLARPPKSAEPTAGLPAPAAAAPAGDVQEFVFKGGERLNSDVAPQVGGRGLDITAVVDTQKKNGVILAQGGLAHGYALYVQDGELIFAARRNQQLTEISGGKIPEGRHTITATWTKAGEVNLAVDGGSPSTGRTAGGITVTPTDGLDVGADRYAAVGPYETPNAFGGTIEVVRLKTIP